MKSAQTSKDRDEILAAIRLNWRLWTIFQAELLAPECPLPSDIRVNVLSISNFIDKHTLELISNPKPEELDILISINRELAGGLYSTPQQPNEEAAKTSPPPAKTGGTVA